MMLASPGLVATPRHAAPYPRREINNDVLDAPSEGSEPARVLGVPQRFGLALERCRRFDNDEAVDKMLVLIQPGFQQVELVIEGETVVDHSVIEIARSMAAPAPLRRAKAPSDG